MVDHKLASALHLNITETEKYFTVPTPFNTLLWRVVVMNAEGYQEGFYSLRKPNQEINFRQVDIDPEAKALASAYVSYKKLQWFAHDFLKTEIIEDHLVISDLRMGSEPDYVFRFAIGDKTSGTWLPITPLKKGTRYDRERLKEIFEML
jgi:inner membrane protein|tara:strand:- start:463 stop:909 length:447 start_codon:yes stop_codon:yes gene_type:complete